jgi:hypothetical protein
MEGGALEAYATAKLLKMTFELYLWRHSFSFPI